MECKGDQSQTCFSSGPPFYQLISLVFGLKYAIILHWQLKTKFGFLSEFGITEVLWYIRNRLGPWYDLKVSPSTVV